MSIKNIHRNFNGIDTPSNIYRYVNGEKKQSKKVYKVINKKLVKVWDITEDKYISKIYIAQTPKITWYQIGEIYDLTGLIVKAKWSDGTETDITEEKEIKEQLPTGEVVFSGLSPGTYNYSKYVDISYSTSAGIKKTRLTLTINPYFFDITCVFNEENGAMLVPTLFFDDEDPTATYWYDVNTSTTTQSTNFTNLFTYQYPQSTSGRRIRISNCNATNVNALPFNLTGGYKVNSIQVGHYIKRIEKNAFQNVTDSIVLYLPRTVEYIGTGAFSNIGSNSKVYIHRGCTVETGAFPDGCDITFYDRENDIH